MKHSLSFIIMLTLLFFLFASSVTSQFSPDPRQYQDSVLIGNRLFIFGGYTGKPEYTNETIYLDLSKPFDTSHPPWSKDVKGTAPINAEFGTACLSPIDNSTVYIIGGMAYNEASLEFVKPSLVYAFNSIESKWTILNTSGLTEFDNNATNIYNDMQAVMHHNLLYIWSGTDTMKPSESNLSTVSTLVTTLNVLNTNTMTWLSFNFTNAPTPREGYTATLLKNGYIVYIGGTNGTFRETNVNMDNIPVFDTEDLVWISMVVLGDTVAPRNSHSAVLTEDGKIIIFGGEAGYGFVRVLPDLAILDTNSIPYQWTVPKNISPKNAPPSLAGHSSIYINNCMLIIFGRHTTDQTETGNDVPLINNQIYIFDAKNYIWISTFLPTSLVISPGQCTTNCIIGIVAAIISILIIIVLGIGWYYYKKHHYGKRIGTNDSFMSMEIPD